MGVMSRLIAAQLGLPPACGSRRVLIERGLRVPMHDGVELVADRYQPRDEPGAMVMLIRSPYGRASWGMLARAMAERGFHVVLQSTRGTHDCGGDFEPGVAEAADGLASVEWMRRQPWFPGAFVTYGQSYLGYVQWALAATHIPEWKAAAIGVAPSGWHTAYTHPRGIFSLANALYWIDGAARLTSADTATSKAMLDSLTRPARLRPALSQLPISQADRLAVGHEVGYYQRWITGDGDYASRVDYRAGAAHLPPTHLAAGWYDFFISTMLEDYAALRRAGQSVRLIVGPGKHESGTTKAASRELLAWLGHYGRDENVDLPAAPVRVYVMGADRWADLADWPPPDATPTPWFLRPGGGLGGSVPEAGPASRYRYDPADPTPDLGGPVPDLPFRYGPRDNRTLEARADVLTFTSDPLDHNLEIIGPVEAIVYVRTGREHADVFTRLCDVAPNGRSTNICDGIVRLRPGDPPPGPDGVRAVRIAMAGTAYRFGARHCIRLQVSGGAHPRFMRNLGTGEPLAGARNMQPSENEVYHDVQHPSTIILLARRP